MTSAQKNEHQWKRLAKIMAVLSGTKKTMSAKKLARVLHLDANVVQSDLDTLSSVIPSVLLFLKNSETPNGAWYFAIDKPDCDESETVTIPRFPTLEDAANLGWIFAQYRIVEAIGHWKLVCLNVSREDENKPTFALRLVLDKAVKDPIEIPVDVADQSFAYSQPIYLSTMKDESGKRGSYAPMFRKTDWEAAIRTARALWDKAHGERCNRGRREHTWFDQTRYSGSIGPFGRMVTAGR
jgi:hypothetical protein